MKSSQTQGSYSRSISYNWACATDNVSVPVAHPHPTPHRILYLRTFSESNAWDFRLLMTGISENILAPTEDFWPFSKDFRKLPKCLKMFQRFLNTSEAIWSSSGSFRTCWRRLTASLSAVYWNIFFLGGGELNRVFVVNVLKNNSSGFVSQAWEIVLNAWDRRLSSTGVRLTHNAWELAGIEYPPGRLKTNTVGQCRSFRLWCHQPEVTFMMSLAKHASFRVSVFVLKLMVMLTTLMHGLWIL